MDEDYTRYKTFIAILPIQLFYSGARKEVEIFQNLKKMPQTKFLSKNRIQKSD